MIKKIINIVFILFVSFCMVMPVNASGYIKKESNAVSKNIMILADTTTTTNWRDEDKEELNKEQIRESCTDFKELIDEYWAWVVLLAPIGLIVLITMDFLKATATGDSDAISKSSSNAIKRTIAALLLLLLPVMLSTIFSMFGLGVCF